VGNRNPVQSDQPENTVLNQSIPAGSKVDAGTASITLDVATAAPPTPTEQPQPTDGGGGQPTDGGGGQPSTDPGGGGQPSPTPQQQT
jgi:beta-lactam-binding protein with PASTA domain